MSLECNQLTKKDGDVIITTPEYRTKFKLPRGKLHVMDYVQDKDGVSCLIMIVDWTAYISKYPFKTCKKLEI